MYGLARLLNYHYSPSLHTEWGKKQHLLGLMLPEEAQRWLRAAAEAGHVRAMAEWAAAAEQRDEQERWWQRAADAGVRLAPTALGDLLTRSGRADEAESWYRLDAAAGEAPAMERLAQRLEEAGHTDEADTWRRRGELVGRRSPGDLGMGVAQVDIGPILTTALITTAIVPFIQTLMAKVAEDTYKYVRGWLGRLFRQSQRRDRGTPHRLLLIDDEDAGITLCLWVEASDDALRALAALDLQALAARTPDQGRVCLVWDSTIKSWRAGEQDGAEGLLVRAYSGDSVAAGRLVEQGLRARADSGDPAAADQLAALLVKQGRLKELEARADSGDSVAAERLVALLVKLGLLEQLGARADAGDRRAGTELARLLEEQGRLEELQARADAGDWQAATRLAYLLEEHGEVEDAIGVLQPHAAAGDWWAATPLARLLVKQGRVEDAIGVLRPHADAGDSEAATLLARLLAM